MKSIRELLFENRDLEYRDFQASLMPTVDREAVIGVRTPVVRKIAKEISPAKAKEFMNELPHSYYEENNLHAFLIDRIKDMDECYAELERFLPYVDNWATCDSLSLKLLSKDKARLLLNIDLWMESNETYTVRFGIGMLMRYFLNEDFRIEYPEKVAAVRSEEYYVNMMCAWYFATALAFQYNEILPFFEEGRLPIWVHNKAIAKACESYRVPKEHKEYLKKLKDLSR